METFNQRRAVPGPGSPVHFATSPTRAPGVHTPTRAVVQRPARRPTSRAASSGGHQPTANEGSDAGVTDAPMFIPDRTGRGCCARVSELQLIPFASSRLRYMAGPTDRVPLAGAIDDRPMQRIV